MRLQPIKAFPKGSDRLRSRPGTIGRIPAAPEQTGGQNIEETNSWTQPEASNSRESSLPRAKSVIFDGETS